MGHCCADGKLFAEGCRHDVPVPRIDWNKFSGRRHAHGGRDPSLVKRDPPALAEVYQVSTGIDVVTGLPTGKNRILGAMRSGSPAAAGRPTVLLFLTLWPGHLVGDGFEHLNGLLFRRRDRFSDV